MLCVVVEKRGRMGMTVIWPRKSILDMCDISFQQMSICWIKKVTGKLAFKIECALGAQTNPKQTQHCNSACTFLRKEEINQSQTSISVCIPLAAHVFQLMKSVHGSPVIDFREALICRLRSGSSLTLLSLSLLSLTLSSRSLPHHFSPFLALMQARTLAHILVCVTVVPWAAYWAVAAVEGKSCRANCLEQYLKSLDMINNVLRGAISHQTAHQKHISPGNYRLTFSNTFISAISDRRCLSKVLYNAVSAWTFSVGGLKMNL